MAREIIGRGSTGEAVLEVQRLLSTLGFEPGSADGEFGPLTEAAVGAFQRGQGLVDDGVIGDATWAALDTAATVARMAATPVVSERGESAAVGEAASASATVSDEPGAR